MLIRRDDLDRIAKGEIDLAFRRWRRPTVKPGGTLRTAVGVLAIDAVDEVDERAITTRAARRAGFASRDDALAALDGRRGTLYRIRLHRAGPDPRRELRKQTRLTKQEIAEIDERLDLLDRASRHGTWTRPILQIIARKAGTPAAELALGFGREKRRLRADIRKLKELGLTHSLRVGYELSPRGEAYLEAIRSR